MKIGNFILIFAGALLSASCSNPYFSMSGGSEVLIERDMQFLETYKSALCNIKDMHEREEISRGRCLSLYDDNNKSDDIKEQTMKRVGYILSNPGKFDKQYTGKLSTLTTEILDCTNYITQNCM